MNRKNYSDANSKEGTMTHRLKIARLNNDVYCDCGAKIRAEAGEMFSRLFDENGKEIYRTEIGNKTR